MKCDLCGGDYTDGIRLESSVGNVFISACRDCTAASEKDIKKQLLEAYADNPEEIN